MKIIWSGINDYHWMVKHYLICGKRFIRKTIPDMYDNLFFPNGESILRCTYQEDCDYDIDDRYISDNYDQAVFNLLESENEDVFLFLISSKVTVNEMRRLGYKFQEIGICSTKNDSIFIESECDYEYADQLVKNDFYVDIETMSKDGLIFKRVISEYTNSSYSNFCFNENGSGGYFESFQKIS
jgi:hypothetical protein